MVSPRGPRLRQSWRRSYTAQIASPKTSRRSWLVLGGPSSSYMQISGLPVSSSVRATMASSASSSHCAASLSRGAAQSSGQFSTANMKPSAQTWPNEGVSWPSISARSSSGRLAMAPRMSMTSGWKASSASSDSACASSWAATSALRSSHSARKRCCCARSLKVGTSGRGSPSGACSGRPSPSSMGSHSAAGTGRRVQARAVRKPSQNSHCGTSSSRVRSSSSRASSSSSSSGPRAGLAEALDSVMTVTRVMWAAARLTTMISRLPARTGQCSAAPRHRPLPVGWRAGLAQARRP